MKSITLLVLNYNGLSIKTNGTSLIDFCMPSFLAACHAYPGDAQVCVIDNNSTDGSVDYIKACYSSVDVFEQKENKWLFAYNDVVEHIAADVVMLLNNDIHMEEHALEPLVRAFNEPIVFSVGADVFAWRNGAPSHEPDSRCLRMHLYKGRIFPVDIGGMYEEQLPAPFYALGGAVAYDRLKFLELGGFDQSFFPYNAEDSDLAFRARLRGWHIRIAEESRVYHLGSATINPSGSDPHAHAVFLRNEFVFYWKNIRRTRLLLQHICWLPYHALRYRFGGIRFYCRALSSFLLKLPGVLQQRSAQRCNAIVLESDDMFLNADVVGAVRRYMLARVYIAANEPDKALRIALELLNETPREHAYQFRQFQYLISDALSALYQSKKYAHVTSFFYLLPDEAINVRTCYVAASSYRQCGKLDDAERLYNMIARDVNADEKLRGFSCYHLAWLFRKKQKSEEALFWGKECLRLIHDHQKCQELMRGL